MAVQSRARRTFRSRQARLLSFPGLGRMQHGQRQDRGSPALAALAVSVSPVAVTEQPIARFIRVTGTLTAEEQADVAAETGGRVVSTPVERGTPVSQGTELIRLSAVETEASVKEAEANAAQIEARLAQPATAGFDVNKVPEVANARASFALAESEFAQDREAARRARRLAVGVRPAQDAGRSRASAVRVREERRRAAVPGAAGRPRARHARAQGGERHGRAGAVFGRRRRAPGLDRRLRDARHEGRPASSASRRCASR